MSLLEKESGTITMTSPGYAKLTKIFRDKYNIYLESCLFKAETLYFELKAIKGSGSAERKAEHFDAWLSKVDIDEFNLESIKKELFRGKNGGLAKPRKSIIKRLSSRDTQFEIAITSDAEGDTDPSVVAWGPRGQKALKDSREAFLNCLR